MYFCLKCKRDWFIDIYNYMRTCTSLVMSTSSTHGSWQWPDLLAVKFHASLQRMYPTVRLYVI